MSASLAAVAALTAAAGAMADVVLTGTIDSTLRMSDDGLNATTNVGRDGRDTTRFIIKGSEDLGDGLKGIYLYEHDFDGFSGAGSDGGGEKFAGLEGGFGAFKIGSPNAPSLTTQGIRAGLFGTKDGGRGAAGGLTAANSAGSLFGTPLTRYTGSILYSTPSFGGFSLAVDFVPATEAKGDDDGQAVGATTDIGLFYKAGPINAGVTYYTKGENEAGLAAADKNYAAAIVAAAGDPVKIAAADKALEAAYLAGLKMDQITYGIQYNLGVAILGLGGHQMKIDGEAFNSGVSFAAIVPLSEQLTLGANYQTLAYDKKDYGTDKTQIAVGVDYKLSKTTAIYARYVGMTPDKGDDVTTTLAGLSVSF